MKSIGVLLADMPLAKDKEIRILYRYYNCIIYWNSPGYSLKSINDFLMIMLINDKSSSSIISSMNVKGNQPSNSTKINMILGKTITDPKITTIQR